MVQKHCFKTPGCKSGISKPGTEWLRVNPAISDTGPGFFENVTRTRPSLGFFLKYKPVPAQAGMGQPGPELGIVKNFKVSYINFIQSFPHWIDPWLKKY